MNKKIENNVWSVLERMRKASIRAGRRPEDTRLLLASKNRSPQQVEEAISTGVNLVGENRVQEMLAKMESVKSEVEWDFIGHLQRNKVRSLIGSVGLIHSVDSRRLLKEIDMRAGEAGVVQKLLFQVNVAGEESKYGFEPGDVMNLLKDLDGYENITLRGLSTVAPYVSDPEEIRWVFRDLKSLGDRFQEAVPGLICTDLSMGMSEDFEVAIEEGSTVVRVGTSVFGPVR
jgi:PLP dependent protein